MVYGTYNYVGHPSDYWLEGLREILQENIDFPIKYKMVYKIDGPPPVMERWFINPMNYSYRYHKPYSYWSYKPI